MLAQFVSRIAALIDEAKTPKVIPTGNERTTRILMPDGSVGEYDREPPARRHTVDSLDSLENAIGKFRGQECVVWVCFERIQVILNDEERYQNDRLAMDLLASPLWSSLSRKQVADDPKLMVNFFRNDCYTAEIDPPVVADALADIRFSRVDEQSRVVSGKNDSMGKSIRAEASGAAKIPSHVEISFSPWPSLQISDVTVQSFLYVDPEERSISFSPLPGSIDSAKNQATKYLAEYLEGRLNDCFVFTGKP